MSDLPDQSFVSLVKKDLSVPLGTTHSSSKQDKIPMGYDNKEGNKIRKVRNGLLEMTLERVRSFKCGIFEFLRSSLRSTEWSVASLDQSPYTAIQYSHVCTRLAPAQTCGG